MSHHETEITLDLPRDVALDACSAAAAALHMRARTIGPGSMVCEEVGSALSFTNPVTLELTASGAGAGRTRLTLNGANTGFGPLQSGHVKKLVEQFSAALEALAHQPAQAKPARSGPSRSPAIVVNALRLSDDEVAAIERQFGTRIQQGSYWYDALSGAWGMEGGPTMGFIPAGLHIGGPLRPDASRGNTGVFINGRELHPVDVAGLQRLGPVWPGRYWVDAQGNFGYEGGPPLGNLLAAMQGASGSGGGPWTVSTQSGTVGGDGQGFLFFNDGKTFWST